MKNPYEIVSTIQRMKHKHIENGGEPTKITMSNETYYTMLQSVQHLIINYKDRPKMQTICGLEIEVRDDVERDTLFIVS